MTENTVRSCSFTGHRDIKEAHSARLPELILRSIEYAYGLGCREFYAGGAVGFDTLAAKEVIRFRMSHPEVRLVLLLPCRNQDEKWTEMEKAVYEFTLSSADEIAYISEEYTPDCMRRSKDFYVFSHNLNVGSVTNTAANPLYTNALIGHLSRCRVENEIANNHFLAGSAAQGIGGSGAREEAISANNAQLSGGEITYLLNEGRTDSIVWYQTLGEDNWPVLFAGHKTVYKSENGTYHNGEDAINMQAADKTGKSSSATYTLKGQKVSQTTKNKDIYIVKGKKVLK